MEDGWGSERGPSSYIADENAWALGFNGLPKNPYSFSLCFIFPPEDSPIRPLATYTIICRSAGDCNLLFFCLRFHDNSLFLHSCLYFLIVFRIHDVSPLAARTQYCYVHRWCFSFRVSHLASCYLFMFFTTSVVPCPHIDFVHGWM